MGKDRKKHSENGGRKPRGYKRSVPTHQFCFDVVLYFEDHSMDATLSKFYKDLERSQLQTKRTSVYLWRKKKGKLVELCNSTGTARLRKVRKRGMDTTLSCDAEVHLEKWISAYRSQGPPVSNLILHRSGLAAATISYAAIALHFLPKRAKTSLSQRL
ncbi:hypothetical protein GQ600_11329 [Phytophthora cactorum]|nr:hypothetical protein GQ600_11329 [Phytophthora cactorum]